MELGMSYPTLDAWCKISQHSETVLSSHEDARQERPARANWTSWWYGAKFDPFPAITIFVGFLLPSQLNHRKAKSQSVIPNGVSRSSWNIREGNLQPSSQVRHFFPLYCMSRGERGTRRNCLPDILIMCTNLEPLISPCSRVKGAVAGQR